jgi:Flp pilus assembly protein TadD
MTPAEDLPALPPRRFAAGAALIVVATIVAYLPALHGGPVWDDDYMLTAAPVMTDPHGLARIWTDLSAVPVYYPLTLSALWLESRVFGLHDLTGYHVVNVLLHAANGVLAWRLLRQLRVRGAFAAGLLWCVHPVAVESVAWVTELKNTLSGLFYLLTMGALLRSMGVIPTTGHRGRWYAIALLTFGLALAAKTTAATLPAAALLLAWYRTGRVRAGQVWAIVPFLIVAAVSGAITQHVETTYTGTWREQWSLTHTQQVLVAGRALWFYAAKLAWPSGLSFAYPRWHVDPAVAWQWAYPAAAVAVVAALWAARRRPGRGPLVGVLFFAGTLAPALGFFHVLYQRYSFVADHFQYLAGLGLIAIATGWIARTPHRVQAAVVAFATVALVVATFLSSRRFASDEAAWSAALVVDPRNPFASLNVATDRIDRGDTADVEPLLAAAAANPLSAGGAWAARGRMAEGQQRYPEAMDDYARSVALDPTDARSRFQLGSILLLAGQFPAAAEQLRAAVAYRPLWAEAHDNLGVALLHSGHAAEAAVEFHLAQQLKPDLPLVQRHLAEAGAEAR